MDKTVQDAIEELKQLQEGKRKAISLLLILLYRLDQQEAVNKEIIRSYVTLAVDHLND